MRVERVWLFVELVMGFRVSVVRIQGCVSGKNGAVEMGYSAPRTARA